MFINYATNYGDYGDYYDNYGDTSIYEYACPLLVGNSMLLFGGASNSYGYNSNFQIRAVYSWDKFTTRRIRWLPFVFSGGKCIYNNGTVYLCFDVNGSKLCRYRYNFILIDFEENSYL